MGREEDARQATNTRVAFVPAVTTTPHHNNNTKSNGGAWDWYNMLAGMHAGACLVQHAGEGRQAAKAVERVDVHLEAFWEAALQGGSKEGEGMLKQAIGEFGRPPGAADEVAGTHSQPGMVQPLSSRV